MRRGYSEPPTASHSRSVGAAATRDLGHGSDSCRMWDDHERENGFLLPGTGAFQRNDEHGGAPRPREKERRGRQSRRRNWNVNLIQGFARLPLQIIEDFFDGAPF